MARHRRDSSRNRTPWGWILGGLAAVGGLAWWMRQIRVGDRVLVDPTKTVPALPAPAGSRAVLVVTGVTDNAVTGTPAQARLADGTVVNLPGPLPGSLTVPRSAVTGKA